MTNLSRATRDIADERDRQVRVEGWSADHDDGHTRGELAQAALCYVATSAGATRKLAAGYRADVLADPAGYYGATYRPLIAHEWPWGRCDFKPRSRRADLVRAGALIVAEIERLDREAGASAESDELPGLFEPANTAGTTT